MCLVPQREVLVDTREVREDQTEGVGSVAQHRPAGDEREAVSPDLEADPARLLGKKTKTSYGKYARCGNENVIEQLLPADYICGFEIVFAEPMIRPRENINVERTLSIRAADREKYQEVVGCRRVRQIVCEFREGRLALDRRQERLKHAVFVNP